MRNKAEIKDKRQFYLKMFSMGSVLIMVLIVILSNVLLDKLLGKSLMFDFTTSGINSISKSTEDILHSLPGDAKIRIIGLMEEPDSNSSDPLSSAVYKYFMPVLDRYKSESDGKVTVEYINPNVDPSIVWELDPNNANNIAAGSCFVVSYNDKISVIDPNDCLELSRTNTLVSSKVEYNFTNAIVNLTQGYFGKAYIISGLGEEGNECIKTILEGINIEAVDIMESADFSVPGDCDLLVLNGPNSDISEETCYAVQDYIKKGGNVFVAVDYTQDNNSADFKNLNKALSTVGIEIEKSQIIDLNTKYRMNDYGTAFRLDLNPAYNSFRRNEFFKALDARPLKISDDANPEAVTEAVLYTSEEAFKAGNESDRAVRNVVMHGGYNGTDSDVYVAGTTIFSSDSFINSYGYSDSNVEFLKACLKALTRSASSSEIPIKSINLYKLDASKITTTSVSVMTVCFMMIIPISLVIVAVAVFTRRKNM